MKQSIIFNLDTKVPHKEGAKFKNLISIHISTIGSEPSKVAAEWNIVGTARKGLAMGGFQDRKITTDEDFQTAAALAIENAFSRAEAQYA